MLLLTLLLSIIYFYIGTKTDKKTKQGNNDTAKLDDMINAMLPAREWTEESGIIIITIIIIVIIIVIITIIIIIITFIIIIISIPTITIITITIITITN